MAENDSVTGSEGADHPDYRRFAGTAVFPRSTTDLTSAALCPACLTILSGPRCGNGQLDLGHPAAVELGRVSAQTAALLERRLELIGRIRHDGRAALAASRDAANAVVRPISTAGPSPRLARSARSCASARFTCWPSPSITLPSAGSSGGSRSRIRAPR